MEAVIEKEYCHHCGDSCEDTTIQFDNRSFCCHGCKAVYELIEASNLHQYYQNTDLLVKKGLDRAAAERKFNFLELQEVQKGLIRYQDEQRSMVRFSIPGIHCSSCIYLLEHLPRLNKGVLKAEVNFIRKEITITFGHNLIALKELAILLSDLGYSPEIHPDSLEASGKHTGSNSIGMKIAVAGFCFGNSMLISLPEYLDVGFQLDDVFKSLFGWINMALAIPVVFFAASDYFRSSWNGIRHSYLNIDVPISLGIVTLFLRSVLEIIFETGPGYVDSLNGLVFFLLLGKWYQGKTYQALSFDRDYTSYFPISVTRLVGGQEDTVMLKELRVGDRILIRNQELVPADGVIVDGPGSLDYSFVTGESERVRRVSGDQVFAGGRQIGGQLVVELRNEVKNSELTQLWNDQQFAKRQKNRYDHLIDKVSKYFTIIILMLAIGTAIFWSITDPAKAWNAATAVLIIACPCALALTLPFAFGHAMRQLGAKGVYLKHANVIEELSKVREIVFDKTGTLTRNDPRKILFSGQLSEQEIVLVKTVTSNSAHPLSRVISAHLGEDIQKLPITSFSEEIGHGLEAKINNHLVRIGSASFVEAVREPASNESSVHVAIDGQYKGVFIITAGYRIGIFEMLGQLKEKFMLRLLSGDNAAEQKTLSPYFTDMRFNQKPVQKLEYVQSIGGQKLMIGDGLNDAGALRSADVGIAVCEDIHQFSPACDAMVQAGTLRMLPGILRFAKKVISIILVAFGISFTYNLIGLSFAVSGNLTPVISAILMPISSVTVVGFITLTVSLYGKKFLK